MSYQLFPLTWEVARRSGSLAWKVADRLATFCEDLQTDDSAQRMSREFFDGLMQQNPTALVWVGLDPAGEIVLHMLASIREGDGKRWIEVTQYKKDGDFPEDLIREQWEVMERWGKTWGCTEVRLATLCGGSKGRITSPRGRLFESGYGFRPYRLVMMKEIER